MSSPEAQDNPAEQTRNCLGCKQRKVRCDRHQPCSTCAKSHRQCVYPDSGRALRRPDPRAPSKRRRGAERAQLLERIRRLEDVVDELGVECDPNPPKSIGTLQERTASPSTTTSSRPDMKRVDSEGRIVSFRMTTVQGSVRDAASDRHDQFSSPFSRTNDYGMMLPRDQGRVYVGDYFWATLQYEVRRIRERLEGMEVEDDGDQDSDLPESARFMTPDLELPLESAAMGSPLTSSFLFYNPRGRYTSLEDLRPMPSQTQFIWQIFVESIDPFVKVLHVPTMMKAIQDARGNFANMDQSMEVLMFSISLAAVRSLSDEDAMTNFNVRKLELVNRFKLGTEQALAQAEFTNTTSIVVIQAFIIYLFATRPFQTTRHTWSLVGLLVRLAVSLGLHRDGSAFAGMSPFEIEIRRRIWWHVCFLDYYAGDRQVSEMSMHEGLFDTQAPLNINDVDINADMTEPPPEKQGFTDVIFCLIQRAAWQGAKAVKEAIAKLGPSRTNNQEWSTVKKSTLPKDFHSRVYCELLTSGYQPDIPLRNMCIRLLDLVTKRFDLILNYAPRPGLLPSGADLRDDEPYVIALSVLAGIYQLKHEIMVGKWAWKLSGFIEWHSLAVVLSRLCVAKWTPTAEEGWMTVSRYLTTLVDIVRQEPLWKPVSKLLQAANRNRDQQLRAQAETGSPSQKLKKLELEDGQVAQSREVNVPSSLWGTGEGLTSSVPAFEPGLKTQLAAGQGNEEGQGGAIPEMEDIDMTAGLAYPLELLNWDEFSEMVQLDGRAGIF